MDCIAQTPAHEMMTMFLDCIIPFCISERIIEDGLNAPPASFIHIVRDDDRQHLNPGLSLDALKLGEQHLVSAVPQGKRLA